MFRKIILYLQYYGFFNFLSDEKYIRFRYELMTSLKLDLNNPKTFNEKLQWLKLHDRKDIYTTMVDKYEAKKYVAKKIGEEYIIPTIGVFDKFSDIDFSKLPNRFVIKCTHDSGGLVICKDKTKFNINSAKKKINKSLRRNYYYAGREWPYKNVKPRIIIEEYMEDKKTSELRDYKFFCFNGKPKFCQVIENRSTRETIDFYDMDWKHQPFTGIGLPTKPFADKIHDKPETFELMKKFAEELSKDIPFLRVDFYEINGKMYFGELTFYPASGFGKFTPEKYDKILGDMLTLPKEKNA